MLVFYSVGVNFLGRRHKVENNERIKSAYDRHVRLISQKPSIATGTQITRVKVREGLTCDIEAKSRKLITDIDLDQGGNDQGPSPGDYCLAGLGGCLAIGYMIHAARLGVPISSLEVEIQGDYDLHGEYGLNSTPAGYLAIRYIVNIESDADETDILRVLDETDKVDSMLDTFRRPIPMERELQLNRPTVN
jgi:uncharacterized OsmC-like protein